MAATVSEHFPPPAATTTPLATATSPDNEVSSGTAPAAEASKNDSWRFIEPQTIREDQVENAVKFLSHPKVKGSPIMYRRSFLERKGLSREEIDESFRRVPDPPTDSSSGTLPAAGAHSTPVTVPQQMPAPVMHPAVGQLAVAQPKSTSWAQMILALGVLTAAGAGAGVLTQRYFLPKLKLWLRSVVLGESAPAEPVKTKKLSPVEEAAAQAAAAAAAAATAASQMAGAMQEIAHSRSEDRQRLDSIIRAVEAQTQELKNALASMKDAASSSEITKYPRSVPISSQVNGFDSMDYWKGVANGSIPSSASEIGGDKSLRAMNTASVTEFSSGHKIGQQARSLTASPTNGPTLAPHSQSYKDDWLHTSVTHFPPNMSRSPPSPPLSPLRQVMAMFERGERPSNIREVNDKPPNPNQPPSNPRLQPRPKPWEKSSSEAGPVSPIYHTEAEQQYGKYVENRNVGSNVGYNSTVRVEAASSNLGAGASSEPWWRKKAEPEVLPSPPPLKITEVDPANGNELTTEQATLPSSSSLYPNGGQAGWVPPSVPQPIYPGAHEAIRRPKAPAGLSSPSFPSAAGSGSASGSNPLPPPSHAENQQAVTVVTPEEATPTQQPIAEPEQQDLAPVEREPEQQSEHASPVEANRTFADVVNED